jgi:hypothetical protein
MVYLLDNKGEEKNGMKKLLFSEIIVFLVCLLLIPALLYAQAEQTKEVPPVAQPLAREGDFAVRLAEALEVGTTTGETEAESILGSVGIAPRNGWIADYPVTPDIIGELQGAVGEAADANRITIGKDEALKKLQDVTAAFNLSVGPYNPGETAENQPSYDNYPDPTVVNNYYYDQGPPVVTYYSPPPDYYYLYSWVPYPFWWSSFWFPGFFVLVDFNKVVIVNKRVEVVSNHFVDPKANKVFRIDPVKRFSGRTFAGIGVRPGSKGFISTGAKGGAPAVFKGRRERAVRGAGKAPVPSPQRGRTVSPPSGGKPGGPPSRGGQGKQG